MLNLVFLPGLLNDARLWQHQILALADVSHPMVADITGADSMSTLASAVLEQAPTGQFALAGLSMGGYVALEIMRQAPERVAGLALLDTSARPDTPEASENRRRLIQLADKDFPTVVDTLLPKMVLPAHLKNDSIAGVFKAMAMSVGKDAFVRQQRAIISRIDSRPHLERITCPTLVLCGRDDAITPVEVHQEIVGKIPTSRLSIVDDCGHLSALEQPKAVTESLKKWLQSLVS